MDKLDFASFHYKNITNIFGTLACLEHEEVLPCAGCAVRKSSIPYTEKPELIKKIQEMRL